MTKKSAREDAHGHLFTKSECTYTSCYCEENVWMLCDVIRMTKPDMLNKCYCVFISNHKRQIPLWFQKSSKRPDKMVFWDYHVIFICKDDIQTMVYDLDTTLPFPCIFSNYISKAITDDDQICDEFRRLFRVIPAEIFLETFASDRSHMLDAKNGGYLSPPPSYPCIQTKDNANILDEFISMESNTGVGTVMKYKEFCDKFIVHPTS